MIAFAGYSFAQNRACFLCQHVLDGAPVMGFAHDEDGDLQIVCGAENHPDDDWHVVGVGHLDLDRMQLMSLPIMSLPTIGPGYAADREGVGGEWKIFPR